MDDNKQFANISSLPKEIIQQRKLQQITKERDKESIELSNRTIPLTIYLIIALVISIIIDNFYWLLNVTPFYWLFPIIGTTCTIVEILSVAGLLSVFIYSFIKGNKITQNYNEAIKTIDIENMS